MVCDTPTDPPDHGSRPSLQTGISSLCKCQPYVYYITDGQWSVGHHIATKIKTDSDASRMHSLAAFT